MDQVEHALEATAGPGGGHVRVRGKDRQKQLSSKLIPLAIQEHDSTAFHHDDPLLAAIAHEQGFDGPPQVVSGDEMDGLVRSGQAIEMWRGVAGYDIDLDHSVTAGEAAEQYRSGDAFYGSGGMYGNGIYAAMEHSYASDATRGEAGGLLRIGLRSDAVVVDYRQVDAEAESFNSGGTADLTFNWGNATREQLRRGARDYPWTDPGRLAASRGVDAIRITRPSGDFYIILNRTATVVQEGQ